VWGVPTENFTSLFDYFSSSSLISKHKKELVLIWHIRNGIIFSSKKVGVEALVDDIKLTSSRRLIRKGGLIFIMSGS
jgi:hypothetical protein